MNKLKVKKKNKNNLQKNGEIRDKSSSRIEIINRPLTKTNKEQMKNYNDFELNTLPYIEALEIDKRNYFQYYISLIKRKQILIFTFFMKDDYNSIYIKICLLFFSFALSYSINALFFTDAAIHKIKVRKGVYNFVEQIPQIIYSTILMSIINIIVTYLSLSEKIIIELKRVVNNVKEKSKEVKKCLKIKFITFFIFIIIILLFFWYYVACFGAIYKNTQIYLIKDISISFVLSLIYPFGICLIPGVFRIPSLKSKKKNKECLYKFSCFIQMI